ncbi:MAG: hypothetical protein PWQ41_461 [Bacillota bacterium]|nr:hypothetical protein [Bacillota bacterium]MDK2855733.1 hypothetical protein [Bacillota bacterium]MDK2924687.1 hypothetical protein [Bacillota bacterium]
MRIIYHCYGGAHSSVAAAAIHLGLLPLPEPGRDAITALPFFDQHTHMDQGRLFFYGTDARGNEVFVLGRAGAAAILERTIRFAFKLTGEGDEILFVNTIPAVNVWMRVGGFLSRRLGWVRIGRPLVTLGTELAIPKLASLVERVRERL